MDSYTCRGFIVLTVRYPDARNFEGKKILVFRRMHPVDMPLAQIFGDELDPHFCESGKGPIARFIPTEEGRRLARAFVESAPL